MDKALISFSEKIASDDNAIIIKALLTVEPTIKPAFLSQILLLIRKDQHPEISDIVKHILGRLQNQDCVVPIIRRISETSDDWELIFILSTCWENGLDFSNHLALLALKVIDCSFEVAVEIMTIIDNLTFLPDNETKNIAINILKNGLSNQSFDKIKINIIKQIIEIISEL